MKVVAMMCAVMLLGANFYMTSSAAQANEAIDVSEANKDAVDAELVDTLWLVDDQSFYIYMGEDHYFAFVYLNDYGVYETLFTGVYGVVNSEVFTSLPSTWTAQLFILAISSSTDKTVISIPITYLDDIIMGTQFNDGTSGSFVKVTENRDNYLNIIKQ